MSSASSGRYSSSTSSNPSIRSSRVRQTRYSRTPVAAIDVQLVVQIVGSTAGRDLHDQLRRPFDVVVVADARLAAGFRLDEEGRIRLELVVEVQSDRGVVQVQGAGRERGVGTEENVNGGLRAAVTGGAGRRCHVDDSLDQLRLPDVRPGRVSAFELASREPVATLQAPSGRGRRPRLRAFRRPVEWMLLRSRVDCRRYVRSIVPQIGPAWLLVRTARVGSCRRNAKPRSGHLQPRQPLDEPPLAFMPIAKRSNAFGELLRGPILLGQRPEVAEQVYRPLVAGGIPPLDLRLHLAPRHLPRRAPRGH